MKKIKNLFLALCFSLLAMLPSSVFAKEVSTENDLRNALEAGESVELTSDITINSASSLNANAGIVIKGTGNITIDGNGHEISVTNYKKLFEIHSTTDVVNVTFTNINLSSTHSVGRLIDTRTGNVKVVVNDSTLTTSSLNNTQPITVGGSDGTNVTIELNNTDIVSTPSGYGIIAFVKSAITLNDSSIESYGPIYMQSGSKGSTVTLNDSIITSKNDHNGPSNNFGAIVLQDSEITVNINNSNIIGTGTGNSNTYAIFENISGVDKNIINLNEGTHIEVQSSDEISLIMGTDSEIYAEAGVTSNVEIDTTKVLIPVGNEVLTLPDGTKLVGKKSTITLNKPENGKVETDLSEAITGQTVTLSLTANEGYEIDKLEIINEDTNEEIKLTNNTFTMPNANVKINATFKKNINPNTSDNIYLDIILGLISIVIVSLTSFKLKKA